MYNYSGREEPFLIIYLQLSFVITSNNPWHDVLIPSLSRIRDPRRGGNIRGILPWPEITNCSLLRIKLCDESGTRAHGPRQACQINFTSN